MEWLQVDVSLFPDETGLRPYIPWRGLATVSSDRIESGHEHFWFVRKPPGLRLRFSGAGLASRFEPVLLKWLVAAERSNDIRGFRFGCYEPEEYRFGGPAGLAIAHDLFHDDSAVVLRYETLDDDAQRRIDREEFALAVTDDLLVRTLDDDAEIWDVWKRLEASASTSHIDPSSEREDPGVLRTLTESRMNDFGSPGASLADAANMANQRAAVALRSLAEAGRLTTGVRSWLAAATAFQWNRWGLPLDLPSLAKHVRSRVRRLQPDGPAD
jgi:thiopeptide-type bacteriocin biosynthesis protein